MRVGMIDVDGHNFPNIPLMKLSAWHKQHGDHVEWYRPLLSGHMDVVYMAKVFSFTEEYAYPVDADLVYRGGTGYHIRLENGKEIWEGSDKNLWDDAEHIYPDYSIYGIKSKAYGFLSRGCPRDVRFVMSNQKKDRDHIK